MQIFQNTNYNFVRWRWHALLLSALVIGAGIAMMVRQGGPALGVEFAGGTIVIVEFEEMPSIQDVRSALGVLPGGGQAAIVQQYGDAAQRQIMIRVPTAGEEIDGALSDVADAVVVALREADLGAFTEQGREIVGPIVGEQLKRQGIWATVLALAGILLYIAFRFQLGFAVGAVVATSHDIFVTLAFMTFFGYDLTLNVIAAILTIAGYSVNDTIVVFDRIRENMRSMRRDNLENIVNVAVNQTLARTIITAGTTLFAVVALFLFGGEVLRGMAFALIVGVISGTYSTVFIASAIAIIWQGNRPLKGQVATTDAAASRRTRRARAS
ncbi:protein translocase subunit SecF [soil metagenome]